ncbi:MAG: hypothetical protein WKF92_08030 [Pyrinomonadaceae bacterium]
MKSVLSLGVLLFALSFCNLGDRLKQLTGSSNPGANNSNNSAKTASGGDEGERPKLTAAQQTIYDSALETKWDQQGMSWNLPAGWKKMDVKKETFNYQSPDNAFLLVNISPMNDDFPMDSSRTAYYDQALQQMKQGKYESVRHLEIDGVKGVEWVETPPEDKDGPRRHQWIGYRNYLGQNQMLNVMLSTKGTNFEKHKDDFPAIMYSMKIPKG